MSPQKRTSPLKHGPFLLPRRKEVLIGGVLTRQDGQSEVGAGLPDLIGRRADVESRGVH